MTEPEPRGAPDSPADAPTDAGHDAAVRSAASAPKPDLAARLDALPRLGVGISGEYGVRPSIDPLAFLETHPGLIHFLEFGTDTERGLDPVIRRWVELGRPATYHFLDVNFEESEDLDEAWMTETGRLARALNAPWICGDSGLWHFGPRDRGHGLLLPPILTEASARDTARSIRRLQDAIDFEVLPENPPSLYFLGDLHILEYFAAVSEHAGCGLLLDLAHLAIFQKARGLEPCDGLDDFPLDRVVEIHVAGGGEVETPDGYRYIDDDHRAELHPDVWTLVEAVVPRAPRLKALCYECEHNDATATVETFRRLNELFPAEAP